MPACHSGGGGGGARGGINIGGGNDSGRANHAADTTGVTANGGRRHVWPPPA